MQRKTYKMVYSGIFAVILALCSWLSIPTIIPFTLQTFGVFLTLLILGGRQGTITIFIYLLLGLVGIPVFSNFGAGPGFLFGNTGGYAIGFLFAGLCHWLFEKLFGKKTWISLVSLFFGLFICYGFGTLWFMKLSMNSGSDYGVMAVLTMCVFPFIIPDILKLWFAHLISKRIRPLLSIDK